MFNPYHAAIFLFSLVLVCWFYNLFFSHFCMLLTYLFFEALVLVVTIVEVPETPAHSTTIFFFNKPRYLNGVLILANWSAYILNIVQITKFCHVHPVSSTYLVFCWLWHKVELAVMVPIGMALKSTRTYTIRL